MKKFHPGNCLLTLLCLSASIFFNFSCSKKTSETTAEHKRGLPPSSDSQDNRPVIAAFGDSLTAGLRVEPDLNYPSQLQRKIDAGGYRYKVVNAGVSGETSSQGLNRIRTIINLRPAIVIVELGANDGLRGLPVETTRRNIAAIVQGLQSAGARVVLAGMRVPPNYGPHYASTFHSIFKDVAKQYDVPLIPFFLEGVGGNAALNQDDGIHPTAEGYKIVVQNVWAVLQPLL
jgi:acyl-CoA thioesterase-1